MTRREFIEKCFGNKLQAIPYSEGDHFNALEEVESLLTKQGLINLDENDIEQITSTSDKLVAISAEAHGKHRSHRLGHKILSNIPDFFWDKKPTNALFNITGSPDITLNEVNDVAEHIYDSVNPHANIIFGAIIDENKTDYLKATVIFGGKK